MVDRRDQVTCTADCRQDCDVGYFFNGSMCAPVCGDRIIVDGEECDRGGICSGGSNPGTLCLVGQAPSSCTGGGVCNPWTGAGCTATCQCDAPIVCGDGNKCGAEECDVGKHCDSGSNFNALCNDSAVICTASGGNCVAGDWVKLCDMGTNRGKDCSKNASICTGGSCTIYGGYCDSSCQVRQPNTLPY